MTLESAMREFMPEPGAAEPDDSLRGFGDVAFRPDAERPPGGQQNPATAEDTQDAPQSTPGSIASGAQSLEAETETPLEDFTAIVVRYESLIIGVLTKMLGSRDDALDVAQATWLKTWLTWKKDPARIVRMKPWLMTVATNTAKDHLRRQQLVREVPFDIETDDDVLAAEPADSTNIEDEVISYLEVGEVLRRMSPNLRRAIILDLQHLGPSEIAAALGLAESSVKVHLSRARHSFRIHAAAIAAEQEAGGGTL